jgi:DNA-binding response OmpR family regulator
MAKILVVTDEPWVRNDVHAALTSPDHILIDHEDPASVADTATSQEVDAVVVDLQVAAMGGMAVTRAVRDATSGDGGRGLPVVVLLDRRVDAFLAKRAGAAGWVTKPFSSHQLDSVIATVLASPEAE